MIILLCLTTHDWSVAKLCIELSMYLLFMVVAELSDVPRYRNSSFWCSLCHI
jgi:hypothetical protein